MKLSKMTVREMTLAKFGVDTAKVNVTIEEIDDAVVDIINKHCENAKEALEFATYAAIIKAELLIRKGVL